MGRYDFESVRDLDGKRLWLTKSEYKNGRLRYEKELIRQRRQIIRDKHKRRKK